MIDTAHIAIAPSLRSFTFSAATLARLSESCAYPLSGEKVLFGIRAGKLLDAQYGRWQSEVTLIENELDGESLRCLLGIWNRVTGEIALFPASTIPHRRWQEKQIASPDKQIANCLGSGAYHYIVGAHEPSHRPFEEGAFRLSRSQPVLAWRFYQPDHQYRLSRGVATLSVVNDHIHSAQSELRPDGISFSSAGCQVIEGDHRPPAMPTGWYQKFRIYAGQSAMPSPLEIGLSFRYLLTHVRHLEAIAQGDCSLRLLQGSVGMPVRQLQEALMQLDFLEEADIDKGIFNGATAKALYHYQKENGLRADGIATERDLKKLGIKPLY